jgi:hypothetical protein
MQLLFAFSALLALTASATNLASSHVPSTGSTTGTVVKRHCQTPLVPRVPELLSITPADTSKSTLSFNLRGQRHLQGTRECPRSCASEASDSTGRQCCAHNGQHRKCKLNGPGDTCKCHYAHDPGQTRASNYECFIDMRCTDQQTWQSDECRTKPYEECGDNPCTTGYKCKFNTCVPSDCSSPHKCLH